MSRAILVQDRSRLQFLPYGSLFNLAIRQTFVRNTDGPFNSNRVPWSRGPGAAALLSTGPLYLTGRHSACPSRQYAYQGEPDSQMHTRPTTYDQSAPPRQVRASAAGLHNPMPPPPTPQTSRFKPAIDHGQVAQVTSQGRSEAMMRPPPTPQRPFSRNPQTSTHRTAEHTGSNRFLLGSVDSANSGPVFRQTTENVKGASLGRQRMAFVPGNTNGMK